jgi:hypothetical protein
MRILSATSTLWGTVQSLRFLRFCSGTSLIWGIVQALQFYGELFSHFNCVNVQLVNFMRIFSATSTLWGTVQPLRFLRFCSGTSLILVIVQALQFYGELFSHFNFMNNCSTCLVLWGSVQPIELYEELFSHLNFRWYYTTRYLKESLHKPTHHPTRKIRENITSF